jgi:hypothetical protein
MHRRDGGLHDRMVPNRQSVSVTATEPNSSSDPKPEKPFGVRGSLQVVQLPEIKTPWWPTEDIAEKTPADPLLIALKSTCGSSKRQDSGFLCHRIPFWF